MENLQSSKTSLWHPGAVGVIIVSPDNQWVLLVCEGRFGQHLKIVGGRIHKKNSTQQVETALEAAAREVHNKTGIEISVDRLEPLFETKFFRKERFAMHSYFLYRAHDHEVGTAVDPGKHHIAWFAIEYAMRPDPMGQLAWYVSSQFPQAIRIAVERIRIPST